MRFYFIILLLLAVVACLPAVAVAASSDMQLGDAGILLHNFQTSGLNNLKSASEKKEKVLWIVQGKEALVRQPLYDITTFTMVMNAEFQGKYLIKSPFCQFNKETQEVHSTAAIQVDNQDLSLTGIGYDIYWQRDTDAITIVVRSAARLVISNATENRQSTLIKSK